LGKSFHMLRERQFASMAKHDKGFTELQLAKSSSRMVNSGPVR